MNSVGAILGEEDADVKAIISEQIGYQTTSYFIKLFKKHEQMTPKHYRDMKKKTQQ
ncbi:AraC family transcriptional regulator [Paenibacillus sp. N4]|nr:AraC family transcriptional regulator [Paenibacillus vietnamensis]